MIENTFLSCSLTLCFSSMQRSGLAFLGTYRIGAGSTDKAEDCDRIIMAKVVLLLCLIKTHFADFSTSQTTIDDVSESTCDMRRGFKQTGFNQQVSSIFNGSSEITEEELLKMYMDAQKRDLWERITQNNKSDIIGFCNFATYNPSVLTLNRSGRPR